MSEGPAPTEASADPSAAAAESASTPARHDSIRAREMALAIRNGLKMGGSLVITWSVALIVKLDVPAHLGPIRQGHFGFAESFAAMFFAALGLGMDTYIIKECAVRPRHASDILGGIFALRGLMSAVIFGAMVVVLLVTHRPPEVLLTVMVFGVTNLFMYTAGTLGSLLQAISYVTPAAIANVATKIVWGGALLVGLHYNAPLPLLALPALASEALRTVIVGYAARKTAGLELRIDIKAVRAALVESAPFYVNALALGILSSVAMSTLEFVRHDEREVGWFAADQNLAALCMMLSPVIYWVVMPLLSRAHARSKEEGMAVFRRCLEGIILVIVPVTVLISAGSDVFVRVAFGAKYAPGATGLAILSLMFVMIYMNILFATHLIIMGRGWSVTILSASAIFITSALMLVFVPLGHRLLPEGGECAGAALAVIGSEACTVIGMVTRYDKFPLDGRNVRAIGKSVLVGIAVLLIDRPLRAIGAARLPLDAVIYVVLAFAVRAVRPEDVATVLRLVRERRRGQDVAAG
jgi:O-antigen/teichoic acid export membrane protein